MNGEQQPPKKKRTWLWIVLGVVLFFFAVTAGGCFVAIYMFREAVSVTEMSAGSADGEFEKVRARFAGQAPLINMVDGRPQFAADRATPGNPQPVRSIHIIAWDDDEAKLVRFSLPFWLLRLKSGPIQLSSYSEGWDDRGVSFRVEDIEKHGPGLLLDVSEGRDGRVIIWVE